jgi:predicted nucleic acid-binding protein
VISELTKKKPNENVLKFMRGLDDSYISIISIHELSYGVELKPKGKAKDQLFEVVGDLVSTFKNQIIPIDQKEATIAGRLRAKAQAQGKTVHMADALIAATAHIRSLTVATRNIKDFEGLDVNLFNPWNE